MIDGIKPYPAMKNSSVEFLGDVPSHWGVRQLGHIGRFSKGNGGTKEDEEEGGVPCVRYGDLYTRHCYFIYRTRSSVSQAKSESYTPIHFGDVLFAGSGETIEEIGKSAVSLISEHACCGGDVIIFRPWMAVDAKFLGLATDCPQAAYQKSCMGRGITVMHIYGDELKYLSVAVPPLREQAAIVQYLDHVDRRVRRLVRAKRKLIALLTEQKQAIIHRAVTRGLDPDVPLKESGVEWLGQTPKHWEVRRVKEVTTAIEQGWSPQCDAQRAGHEEWGVLKVGCVNHDVLDLSENKRLPKSLQPRPELQIRDGDILVSRANTRELLGLAAEVVTPRPRLLLCDKLFRFRARNDLADRQFLVSVLRSRPSRDQIETQTNGASDSMQNIGQDVIRNLVVALPPLEEQQEISSYIASECSAVTSPIALAKRKIELLDEYRTRLIADVVTGKVDVREAASRLPIVDPRDPENEEDDTRDAVTTTAFDELDPIPNEAEE